MTSTYRRKTKTKKKLRHLTSIMPILIWQPDQMHMFRMPFHQLGGMRNLQLHTPIKSRKKKVWANVYQKLSHLPHEIYMKDIKFGFTPKNNYMGWNVDEHGIVWANEQVTIPINEIIGLSFKGTAITYTAWTKTYNPYSKYNKFTIDILRNNNRIQTSLPSIMKTYKDKGIWKEIKSIKKDIYDITTSTSLGDMWNAFNDTTYYDIKFKKEFIIPNPISSVRIDIGRDVDLGRSICEKPLFNFLLNKDTIKRHSLKEHISSAPKPIDKTMTPYTKDENEPF